MYVRFAKIDLDPAQKSAALEVINKFIPLIKSQPGCMDCNFLTNDELKEYAMVVNWDSKENADAAMNAVGSKFIPELNKVTKEPVKPVLYKVYEGK